LVQLIVPPTTLAVQTHILLVLEVQMVDSGVLKLGVMRKVIMKVKMRKVTMNGGVMKKVTVKAQMRKVIMKAQMRKVIMKEVMKKVVIMRKELIVYVTLVLLEMGKFAFQFAVLIHTGKLLQHLLQRLLLKNLLLVHHLDQKVQSSKVVLVEKKEEIGMVKEVGMKKEKTAVAVVVVVVVAV
jgi:hypothetical protein